MIVTNAEAKQKQCCQSDSMRRNCTGSHCMGWRWHDTVEEYIYEERAKGAFSITPPTVKRIIYKPKDEWTGFCGIAGK